jgi:hypothetical protein
MELETCLLAGAPNMWYHMHEGRNSTLTEPDATKVVDACDLRTRRGHNHLITECPPLTQPHGLIAVRCRSFKPHAGIALSP